MSKNQPITDAEEIIERFGGIRPMAKKINVAVTTVQGWKKRNVIPAARRSEIVQAAEKHNVDISDILSGAGPANENLQKTQAQETPVQETPSRSVPQTESEKMKQKTDAPAPSGKKDEKQTAQSMPAVSDLERKLAETEKKAMTKSVIVSAVLIIMTAALAAVLFWPAGGPRPENSAVKLGELESEVDQLQSEIDAVKQEQSFLSGMVPENLAQRLEELRMKVQQVGESASVAVDRAQDFSNDVLAENAGSLEQRIAALEKHMVSLSQSPQVTALVERFQEFRNSEAGRELLGQSVYELNALLDSGAPEDEGQISATLDAARQRSIALGQAFENVPGQDLKAAALLLGMTQFRSSLNRDNQPFEEDMVLLKKLVGNDNPELLGALERLAPYAEEGVLTPGGLTNEFKSLTGEIVVSSLKGEDVSFTEKMTARFNELFQIEKEGELMTGTDTQAKVNRAQNLLEDGQLEAAIAEVQSLDGPAAVAAGPWLKKAQATLNAQNIKGLINQAMSAAGGGGQLFQDKATGINIYRPAPRLDPGALGMPQQ